MFFGLEVKSNQNQAKPITVTNTLKLSQAVLEPGKNTKKEPVSLVAEYQKKQFILCVLDPNQSWQCQLDLLFEAGSQVKFFLRGQGTVHLTGYENFDDLDDMSMSMSSDEDISEEEGAQQNRRLSKASTNGKKATNGLKNPSKLKAKADVVNDDDEDDDSEDDLDFQVDETSDDGDEDDDEEDENEDEDMSDEDLIESSDDE